MNKATKEKHISVFEEDHVRLQRMAKAEGRTMRSLIGIMLNERESKMKRKRKYDT